MSELNYYLIGFRVDTPIKARISSTWMPGITVPSFKQMVESIYNENIGFEGSAVTILSISKLTEDEFKVFKS